ncbi:MAG: DUF4266 domain-containing protein [Ignavibacteria bacterium]|nr:DUF4266 domain-containing protein [Ignavibacteria bacterium]
MKAKILYILLFFVFLLITGCAVVQPWERERLADPNMIFDENPIQKGVQDHYINIREGSEGGNGSESGGCGCG